MIDPHHRLTQVLILGQWPNAHHVSLPEDGDGLTFVVYDDDNHPIGVLSSFGVSPLKINAALERFQETK